MLEATDVSAWFGRNKVLERVSLVMEPRKVTALIGPSGCGKSTFLRILNRMHELVPKAALSGSVRLDGVDVYGPTMPVTQTRLRIGMVFQRANPFPSMTIAQNVLSGLRLSGTKVSNPDALVRECLERAGLWRETRNRLNQSGAALSGGQLQRSVHCPFIWRFDRGSYSWTNPVPPWTRFRPASSKARSRNSVTKSPSSSSRTTCSRPSGSPTTAHSSLVDGEGLPGHIVEAGPTEEVFNDPIDPRTADYVHGVFG